MKTKAIVEKSIAIVCQGGGSHAAYAAGALQTLLPQLENKQLRLVGISGTSGGAICALLAWYGMLQGGPECAHEKLNDFWQSNCARLPGEKLWNDCTVQAMGALPCEILFSPYQWPMLIGQTMLTKMWPALASSMEPYGWFSYKSWARGDFFQLDELIKRHVDFELVSAVGNFCSIPSDIERWRVANLQSIVYGELEADPAPNRKRKLALQEKIKNNLDMPQKIEMLMDKNHFSDAAPLRASLRDWSVPKLDFTEQSLKDLSVQMAHVMRKIPQLLLGAVDVGNGEFTAFSSERSERENGISLNAVLASAALPWLFKAVSIEGETLDGERDTQQYWDGLFSQNPPIKNFISGSSNARKPDEFWVIQINPVDCDLETLKQDIWDRRNELSGNLSLNQEIAFISAINKRIDRATDTALQNDQPDDMDVGDADKHVQVHRIIMDGAAIERKSGKTLNALSKFDRDASLEQALTDDGQEQAQRFFLMRSAILDACNDLDRPEYASVSPDSAATLDALKCMTTEAGQGKVQLIIDETTMPSISRNGKSGVKHHALARWHARGMYSKCRLPVSVEGETEFDFSQNGQFSIHVREIRITAMEQLPSSTQQKNQQLLSPTQPKPARIDGEGRQSNA